jgi:hypothetical protein
LRIGVRAEFFDQFVQPLLEFIFFHYVLLQTLKKAASSHHLSTDLEATPILPSGHIRFQTPCWGIAQSHKKVGMDLTTVADIQDK